VILRQARGILATQFHIDHITLQPEWLRRDQPPAAVPIKPSS
jgi:hypothetical protein